MNHFQIIALAAAAVSGLGLVALAILFLRDIL